MRRLILVTIFVLLVILGATCLNQSKSGKSESLLRVHLTRGISWETSLWTFTPAADLISSLATLSPVSTTTVPPSPVSQESTVVPMTPMATPGTASHVITPTAPVTSNTSSDSVTPAEYAEWSKVNVCENGGSWTPVGSVYPDGLGINRTNWYAWGGSTDLSPDAQILVAERGEALAGEAGYVPDQGYCASW